MTSYFKQYLQALVKTTKDNVEALAKSYAPSDHIRKTIKSTSKQQGEDKFRIIIQAGPTKQGDAKAREYGSGVWAQRGPRGKILILPKRKPMLIFPWDVPTSPVSGNEVSPLIPRTKKGHVILKRVEHPGVDAANGGRGYLRPAAQEVRNQIMTKSKADMIAAIKVDIKESFRTKK